MALSKSPSVLPGPSCCPSCRRRQVAQLLHIGCSEVRHRVNIRLIRPAYNKAKVNRTIPPPRFRLLPPWRLVRFATNSKLRSHCGSGSSRHLPVIHLSTGAGTITVGTSHQASRGGFRDNASEPARPNGSRRRYRELGSRLRPGRIGVQDRTTGMPSCGLP